MSQLRNENTSADASNGFAMNAPVESRLAGLSRSVQENEFRKVFQHVQLFALAGMYSTHRFHCRYYYLGYIMHFVSTIRTVKNFSSEFPH